MPLGPRHYNWFRFVTQEQLNDALESIRYQEQQDFISLAEQVAALQLAISTLEDVIATLEILIY